MDKRQQVQRALFEIFESLYAAKPSLSTDMAAIEDGVEQFWLKTEVTFGLAEGWTGSGEAINKTLGDYIEHVARKWDGITLNLEAKAKTAAKAGAPTGDEIAAAFDEGEEGVRALIDRLGNVDAPLEAWRGYTLLQKACEFGDAELAKLLLDRGANPNTNPNQRESALQLACVGEEKLELVEALIERGADVDAQDHRGLTALHVAAAFAAAFGEKGEVLRALRAAGANTELKTTMACVIDGENKVAGGARPIDVVGDKSELAAILKA